MEQKGKSGAIRLTNKTAIALRRSAANVRHVWLVTAAVLTLLLACLAVYLGMRWLHAVPVVVAVTVLLDAVIGFHARNRYLQIVGQAICTEAAARNMRSGSESERIRRAARDLMRVKQDVLEGAVAPKAGVDTREWSDVLGVGARPPHRRRRQAGFEVIESEKVR